jgi:acetyl esterase/lipase
MRYLTAFLVVFLTLPLMAAEKSFTRHEDVIYGRVDGTALTMDVFTTMAKPNRAAVLFMVSGGWVSSHDAIGGAAALVEPLTARGYTVFAVVHASTPKYTIPEILPQISRAVRFVRYHAADYGIDPNRIGITGGSAGGHLSLMQGTHPLPPDPKARDPIDRESAAVQAVACLFPPTDFLNYGKVGNVNLGTGPLASFHAPFDFREWSDAEHCFVVITDEARRIEIGRQISPIYFISTSTPPTLIFHGDSDPLVPIQQSESFVAKCKEMDVTAELRVKDGGGHGWLNLGAEMGQMADWFDAKMKGDLPGAAEPAGKLADN